MRKHIYHFQKYLEPELKKGSERLFAEMPVTKFGSLINKKRLREQSVKPFIRSIVDRKENYIGFRSL